MTSPFDVAVVGGGPAGLSAAVAAAEAGASVLLVDEQSDLGGELRYRIAPHRLPGHDETVRPQQVRSRLLERVDVLGVVARPETLVWGLFDGPTLALSSPQGRLEEVLVRRVVIASGSTDCALPFPGSTLPGVWTARAVQMLLHLHRLRPGKRFAVVGGGGEGSEVAADIRMAGGEVAVVADSQSAVAAEGVGAVTALTVNGQRHDVDVVVVAAGRQPDIGLAQMAGCPVGFDLGLGGWVPRLDASLRADDLPIFVAGNAAGSCDIATAMAEGRIAGLAAAESIGLAPALQVAEAVREHASLVTGRAEARQHLDPTHVQAFR